MKRHHAAEAPPASGVREEIETDKMDKFAAKGRNLFYRVCLLVVVATTFLTLVRHFYCSGLSDSAVVIGPLSDPSSSLFNIRKLSPVARSNHSPPPPPPPADTGDKNPSSSGSLSDAGETTLSDSSTSASDAGDKPLSNPSGTSEASSTADEAALSNPSASASDVGDKPLSNSSGSSGETSPTADGKSLPNPSSSAADGEQHGGYSFARALAAADDKSDPCGGRYIYVQELPPRFNIDLVRDCATLFPWTDMCTYTANGGFGARLSNAEGVFQDTDWYDSDQYTLDISFHDRIKRYECLTNDSPLAAAVFVPFYAGLEVARHLWGYNVSTRDALALEMVGAVTARPEWRAMGGRDHFFVAGRTTWDFRRLTDADREWGSKLFRLPAVRNMTALVVEASPWHSNDAAVPFPTAFHPARDEDVFLWQERVRALERQWLFSFAGAPRPGDAKSIRNELIEQCKASTVCSLLQCGKGPTQCFPASFMKLFQSSTFCLQPRGDSATRKSAFDAMLAGCIPVFFHPATMYVQYFWHLPRDYTKYSVYISEEDVRSNVSIEERLRKIPADEVERMRATVIDLVPTVVYSDPSSKLETIKDAFDVTVKAVIDKVTKLRRDIVEGRQPEDGGPREMYSWKYPLLGKGQKVEESHEWDPLFAFD